ncbi:MAG: cytochrome c biogenesis protein CcsA [Candidatus Hodarchaeota archaeon]
MIDVGFGLIEIDLGLLLLIIGFLAFLIDVFIVLIGDDIKNWEAYSEIALTVGASALIVSFLYFCNAVLSADYSFVYVTDFVNNNMDFFMRISAIWSGQSGSYFFWTFLAVLLYLIFRAIFRDYAHEPIFWRSFAIFGLQVAILGALTLLSDPFRLDIRPVMDGAGLNPLLMNIWNLIHPPIIFIGYALCLIPFVIGIARLTILEDGKIPDFDGKKVLENFTEFMISIAWLVLSSGIIIGGYWAYVTLGWGGFWAWDPVETASLIPWLFLTLYYHGKSFHRKSPYLANYILSMSYISVLFATYLTRSGIVSSVHAFKPTNTLENFLATIIPSNNFLMSIILRFIPDEKILFLFLTVLISFFVPHFIGIKTREILHLPISIKKEDFQVAKSRITALKLSYLAFLIGTFALILGLIFPVIFDIVGYLVTLSPDKSGFWFNWFGSSISINALFYNTILTIFGGIMLLTQFFCTFYPRFSLKSKFGIIFGGIIASILFTVSGILYRSGVLTSFLGQGNPIIEIFRNFWTASDKANLVIPLLILGIVGLFIEFFNIAFKEEKNFIRKTSQAMLHLSFLVILLGALLSANMTTTTELVVQPGEFQVPGTSLIINILDLDKTVLQSGIHSVEYDTEFVISSGSRVIGFGISRLAIDNVGRMDHEVTIISNFFSDIYIVTGAAYESPTSGSFQGSLLQIKIIPYINILWAGCLLLHFAIIPLTIGRFVLLRNSYLTFSKEMMNSDQKTETQANKEEDLDNVVI